MKLSKSHWYMVTGGALILVGAGIYFFVVRKDKNSERYGNAARPLAQRKIKRSNNSGVQITQTSDAIVEPDWDNPYNKDYFEDVKKWIAPKTLVLLKDQFAKQYAAELYNAKGVLDDDEDMVYNVFSKKAKDKVQVSNISRAFYTQYKKDMYEYLKSFLSEDEIANYVHAPVRNLPNYRVA